ncbi:MAG TPA: DUF5946 family protein [Vicinamibacterales bacterium]|nr:DUF5946 family protein [Vicinamibacterales bacterium]
MIDDPVRAAYDEVYAYTMQQGGASFILQHVVDAFKAQTAGKDDKPIGIVFALVGLYLRIEKHYSGRQVQRAHMRLGRQKREWPVIELPANRGSMTVLDVAAVPEGPERDLAIDAWCRSVWAAFHDSHATIAALLREHRII